MVRSLGVEPSISRVQGGHHTPQSASDNMVRIGSAALPASESQTQRSANMSYILIYGSSDWTRTSNPAINSRMLCQLSYGGPSGVRVVTTRWRIEL